MIKNLTEVVFILDASGSMSNLTADTIGGVNGILKKQREQEGGEVLITTVLFNTKTHTVHDRIPLSEVADLTEKEYVPCGGTALLDAVGETVSHIKKVHHYIRGEDVPQKTMVVIMTDGEENSSCTYDYSAVKKMVQEQEKDGWEFLFLAANINAAEHSVRFGIAAKHAVDWVGDKRGQRLAFEGVAKSVGDVRLGADMDSQMEKNFFAIREDFKKRGGKK